MISRREFVQVAAATAALAPGGWSRAFAQQRLTQADLLRFDPLGNVTLAHISDLHAQLRPVLFREPSINIGVGDARGKVPHITGRDFREDIYDATALTYPAAYRTTMSGARLKEVLEDVANNLFNPDPYYQQGGDMARVGGVSYIIDIGHSIGRRISDLRSLRTGQPLDAAKEYMVAGWASVNEGTEGPPIWDVVMRQIEKQRIVAPREAGHVRVVGN